MQRRTHCASISPLCAYVRFQSPLAHLSCSFDSVRLVFLDPFLEFPSSGYNTNAEISRVCVIAGSCEPRSPLRISEPLQCLLLCPVYDHGPKYHVPRALLSLASSCACGEMLDTVIISECSTVEPVPIIIVRLFALFWSHLMPWVTCRNLLSWKMLVFHSPTCLLLKLKSVTRYCVLEINNIVSLPLLPLPTCQLHPTLESQTSPSLLLPRRSVTSLSLIKYSLPGIDACWCSCLCLSRQSLCR